MENIEKDNKEKDSVGNKEGGIDKISKPSENKESGIDKKIDASEKFALSKLKAEIVSDKEKNEANTLVEGFDGVKKVNTEKTGESNQTSIQENIKKLNRPQAEKGLEKAYVNMEETIKNSPNDKNWFASLVGKAMNGILNG